MTLGVVYVATMLAGPGAWSAGPPVRWAHAGPGASTAPASVVIATARGERRVAVRIDRGHPVIPTTPLFGFLPVTAEIGGGWATVRFATHPFRFLLDAPAMVDENRVVPLLGGAYVARDTLFVPLQWLAEFIPTRFAEGYRYDPLAARFEEAGLAPVVRATPGGGAVAAPLAELRRRHVVTIDAGHGGPDAGTRGIFLPRGVQEKHIALAISKRVRAELERRGIGVIMTRTTDTLISLYDRAGYCDADCDLFVSIHVDALAPRPGYQQANGLHTYFLGNPRTGEARRVTELENEALRYESDRGIDRSSPLTSILRDLEHNEYVRESALLAELVQSEGARVHPGTDKGVQQARFVVLTTAKRPAVLVETGFGTNRSDAAFLASESGQQRLAAAIADGIVEYLRRYEGKTGVGIWP